MRNILPVKSVCLLFIFLMVPLEARSALIQWNPVTDTTSVTDISTNGILLSAFNGGTSTTTANGVTFNASGVLGMTFVGALDGGNTGDAGFDTLLNEFTFGGGTGDVVFDIGSFVAGSSYEVQVFYTDQRPDSRSDRIMRFDDDGTGTNGFVDLESNPDNTTGTPFGQFAIGTFTSDGTDLNLILNAQGFGNAHITAWQIRSIVTPVPEPSLGILLVMGLGLTVFGKRRRRG